MVQKSSVDLLEPADIFLIEDALSGKSALILLAAAVDDSWSSKTAPLIKVSSTKMDKKTSFMVASVIVVRVAHY